MKVRTKDGNIKEIIYSEKQLYQYGLNRLSSREWGRGELKKKMLNLQPDENIVNLVLTKLETQGYLSNNRRIQSILNQYSNKEALNKTLYRLTQKGFSKDEIHSFFEINEIEKTSYDVGLDLLTRKFKEYNSDNYQKMTAFLVNKGFQYDYIKKALSIFKNGHEE